MKPTIIALAVLCAAPALAQTTAAPAPGLSTSGAGAWDGFYSGINLGWADGSYSPGVSSLGERGPGVDVDGAFIALRLGQNWTRGRSVFGWDADVGTGPDGSTGQGTAGPDYSCVTGDCVVNIAALYTLRGRYGLLVNPETLVYGAAGVAVGLVDGGIENSAQFGDSTATGFTLGVGVERQVLDGVTVYGEVSHVDLGTLEFGTADGSSATYDADGTFDTLKLGLNFRF